MGRFLFTLAAIGWATSTMAAGQETDAVAAAVARSFRGQIREVSVVTPTQPPAADDLDLTAIIRLRACWPIVPKTASCTSWPSGRGLTACVRQHGCCGIASSCAATTNPSRSSGEGRRMPMSSAVKCGRATD